MDTELKIEKTVAPGETVPGVQLCPFGKNLGTVPEGEMLRRYVVLMGGKVSLRLEARLNSLREEIRARTKPKGGRGAPA